MSVLYKRIEELCREHGETITTMCKASGASRASLSDLKVGRKQSLSAETLSKIAAHFNVSVDYLLSGCYRSSCTAYPNGITVFSGGSLQDIEERMSTKEPGTFRIVYQSPGTVITVDIDSDATLEQINSVIALYTPNSAAIENKTAPTLTEKDERCGITKKLNVVRIAGRDGSYEERYLTDSQLAAVKAVIDQMPDATEDL